MAFGDPSSNFFQSSAAREEEDKSASALDFNAPNRDDPLIMRMPSWRQSMGLRTPGPALREPARFMVSQALEMQWQKTRLFGR
jgi:hypothetical protein